MTKIKKNIVDIKTSATLEINELSQQLEKNGQEIFKFGLANKSLFRRNYLIILI